jgi:hypothetical protein
MKMLSNIKTKLNKELALFNNYFPSIPLDEVNDVLKRYGYLIIQEDGTPFSGFLCGENSRASFEIGSLMEKSNDGVGGLASYGKIDNTTLQLNWYKMPSGRYEITCYMS